MGSEASFNEWERYMDSCARRLLEDSGETPDNKGRSSKSNKKGSKRVLRKRGKGEKKPKSKVGTNGETGHRSKSRAVKRQKSKTGGKKESSEEPEGSSPQKRKRQRSIAYDNEDIDQIV